jgi:Transketolase
MPSIERFEAQPREYRESVIPSSVPQRIAMEAAAPMSWFRLVGDAGEVIALDRFGASAPYERIYQELGLTAEHVVERARSMLGR